MRKHTALGIIALVLAQVPAVSIADRPSAVLMQPRCSSPAPVLNSYDPGAEGFIVKLRGDADIKERSGALAKKYGIKIEDLWETLGSYYFSTRMSSEVLAALRCDRDIENVEYIVMTHTT